MYPVRLHVLFLSLLLNTLSLAGKWTRIELCLKDMKGESLSLRNFVHFKPHKERLGIKPVPPLWAAGH